MRKYDKAAELVYGNCDGPSVVRDFQEALSVVLGLREIAQEYRDEVLPKLFALEAEDWRRTDHPDEELSKELLLEDSFEKFVFDPCGSDIQSYFQALSVGDWEQLLREYLEDNTDAILKTYHELFDD